MDVRLESRGQYWYAAWVNTDGTRGQKSLGNKAKVGKRQAQERCRQLQGQMDTSPASLGNDTTMNQWLSHIGPERKMELALHTYRVEQATIAYLREYFGDERLDRIQPAICHAFRVWLSQEKGLGETTVANHCRKAKTLLQLAVDREVLYRNPFRSVKTAAPKVVKDWDELTEEMVAATIAACPNPGWKALVGACGLAGLRRGEAMALSPASVRDDRLVVDSTKTGRRVVRLEPELTPLLAEGLPVLRHGVSRNNLHRTMVAIIQKAGLEPWADPFQNLRRWRDTSWKMRYPEWIVDEWLGHSVGVSRSNYIRVPEEVYG